MKCSRCLKDQDKHQIFRLRTGDTICKSCTQSLSESISTLTKQIDHLKKRRNPPNLWNILSVGVAIACVWVLVRNYHKIPNSFVGVMLFVGFVSLSLGLYALVGQLSISKNQPKAAALAGDIKQLQAERHSQYLALFELYEQFWDLPPDWRYRRRLVIERANDRCEECAKALGKAGEQRHVHHIVPRASLEGNHSLSNLRLLCEDCHSVEESPGHWAVGNRRSS